MYECAQRLKREIHGIESLKRQQKCLLACLNLLKLVEKKFAWLAVTNTTASSQDTPAESRFNFLNNLMSSNSFGDPNDLNINVDIADYDEINRDYMLVDYMIRLSKIMSNQSSIGKN